MEIHQYKRKILIVDDHPMVRDGIRVMLQSIYNKKQLTIHDVDSGEDAIEKIKHNHYDIIIMDYHLRKMNGAETLGYILEKNASAKILALSNSDAYSNISEMLRNGACGYLLKNISANELKNAIEIVLEGKKYYSAEISQKIYQDYLQLMNKNQNKEKKKDADILSKKEIQIVKLLLTEKTLKQISNELHISIFTLNTHRTNIYKKLNIKSRHMLIKWVANHGI